MSKLAPSVLQRRRCTSMSYGQGMSQEDMMNKDMLILVDGNDNVWRDVKA